MGFLLSLLFGFIPMFLFAGFINWLDRYEKEPRSLLGGAFIWGAIIAAGTAFLINTTLGLGVYALTGSEGISEFTTGSLIAPIVEEILKGFAVLLVFFIFRTEFDSILDGIVYAAITALGFAATENVYYIYTYGFLENGFPGLFSLVFVRVILVGWQHPFYTAFFGIGLAKARLTKNTVLRFLHPLIGLTIGILAHSLHNTLASILTGGAGLLAGTILDWVGWFFMLAFIVWMILRERNMLAKHLAEEVTLGIITPNQYKTSYTSISQVGALISSFGTPKFNTIKQFYQLCAELAHKKHQYALMGNETNNWQIIESLRIQISQLSALIS